MFPEWLRYGPKGLLAAAALFLVPYFLKRELANDPTGSPADPLKPKGPSPSAALFRKTEAASMSVENLKAIWRRRWSGALSERGRPDPEAVDRATRISTAHTLLANDVPLAEDTVTVTNFNLLRRVAGRFDKTRWTVVAVQEWDAPRPVFRWLQIRSYLSADEAAAEWIRDLPEEAVQAAQAGDTDAYLAALAVVGKIGEGDWRAELIARYRLLGSPLIQKRNSNVPAMGANSYRKRSERRGI